MNDHSASSRPWYREPWPWILMAGPAAALAACIVTVYLATVRHADPPITEGATREGLVVRRIAAPIPPASPPTKIEADRQAGG
ncbi:lipoprotein [Bordetella bronchialis]|uniref:Lipoprotein n=1 Tax=Bordetella bronchialis TaxID=463025 RepID=A0ABM6CT34_9BORD|nr:lipoprotein [Bordetella bronchialis]ANN67218.1 lipoprotein [Bordetella bronchialis]